MTVDSSPIYLWNVEQNASEDANLLDSITERQLVDWEGEWMPELFKAMQKLRQAGVDRKNWPQSRHWDWRRKTEDLNAILAQRGFSIICKDLTQGMMIVDTVSRCRLEEQKGQHLVYIQYLESAPWNRKELLYNPPRYKGIGTILINAAIMMSEEEGFKSRIGLHSLPQADNFYAGTCGMTDLGKDPSYHDLRYFEMTTKQAQVFIEKGGCK